MTVATTTSLKLDRAMRERIQKLADTRRRSAHWIMREAIEEYVLREERREGLRKDAIDSWSSYEATGLHLTEQEADDWLAKLEVDEDAKAPECHV